MNESDTRLKKIDPALKAAGWGVVDGSDIFTEQRAYILAPGRIARKAKRNPDRIDYLLVYKGVKLAVVEAKSDEKDVSEGVEQAKRYASAMNIRWAYSTNGDSIWAINMQPVKGGFTEDFVTSFPSPDELWQQTFPDENLWRDRFNLCRFHTDIKKPRYYQENAVNAVLQAISQGRDRILLTLATGTGKTYIAFQICWKLYNTHWNAKLTDRLPRILFLADRNILADQAFNAFSAFDDTALARITPDEIRKKHTVPTGKSIYFTIFQTLFCTDEHGNEFYRYYPADFFDFVIIDECHRGGANDESEWRKLMEYYKPATQLGLTATPKRKINSDTYRYFGEPVYVYSLRQGIEDGFLTPYRVKICKNKILDEYQYSDDDLIISGSELLDRNKTYTEQDFYRGDIRIKERDETRVQEFLDQISPDEKTIVFCATQNHAMQIRDLINKNSHKPHPFYCVRVTSNDGEEGEKQLRMFQDNEKTIPTILTTSQKLSTGVDAQNVRNIVLMRPVPNMIEFKQIIGRGTRLFDDKYYFTIYDFVGAYQNFNDPEWDGEPCCPECGNVVCTCGNSTVIKIANEPKEPYVPKPCPRCGNLPCTCPKQPKDIIEIELSPKRKLQARRDFSWNESFMFDGKLISIEEFVKILFGRLPDYFTSGDDLKTQWQNPDTREQLLKSLESGGFPVEKIARVQSLLNMDDCDLLDVLEYLAFDNTPINRSQRVAKSKNIIITGLNVPQIDFMDFVMQQYIRQGYNELWLNNLSELLKLKYGSLSDSKRILGGISDIKKMFVDFQKNLYAA